MGEDLHDIDKLFRDSLEEHQEMPSAKVWDALDSNLDKTNVIQIKRKYNNLKRLAIALLLLLLATIIYEIQSKKPGAGTTANNNAEEKTRSNNDSRKNSGSTAASTASNGNSNSSNSNNINNAGNDTLNNSEQQAAQIPGINTTTNSERNTSGQQNAAAVKNAGQKNKDKDITAGQGNDNAAVRPALKKGSGYKTKMTVKNGVAAEELVAGENEKEKNQQHPFPPVFNSLNELTGLQTNKAVTINTSIKKEALLKVDTKRISPDANSVNTAAANKNLKNPKPFHFNVTAFYSPQFGSTTIKEEPNNQNTNNPGGPPPPPPGSGSSREHIKNEEQTQRAFSAGVLVDIPLGKKWAIQSGITYLKKEISIEPKKIYAKLDKDGKAKYVFDCSSGYTYLSSKTGTPAVGDSINVTASANTLQYVGIPLGVNYTFSAGKFNIIPSVGTTANFLVKQKIETELIQGSSKEKQTINSIQGMKSAYFNAFAGVALEYNVSKRIAVSVTPSGNFALSSINKNAAVKSYPNSFGIAAGLKIKF